MKPECKLI